MAPRNRHFRFMAIVIYPVAAGHVDAATSAVGPLACFRSRLQRRQVSLSTAPSQFPSLPFPLHSLFPWPGIGRPTPPGLLRAVGSFVCALFHPVSSLVGCS